VNETLDGRELGRLIERVFRPQADDTGLAILIDLPDDRTPDHLEWAERRALAAGWAAMLAGRRTTLGLDRVTVAWYRNSGGNNADLPPDCWAAEPGPVLQRAAELAGRPPTPFETLFAEHTLVLAPTEHSTTAPLKVAARSGRFRAATMPGFSTAMIPALRIDYGEVDRRVRLLKAKLDEARAARLIWEIAGERQELLIDLRHRLAHASGGLFPENGVAGNLPSGEAYIVPYEGERDGDPSRTAGRMPVEIDGEVVLYEIDGNRAVGVLSSGAASEREAERIAREPAYANLAELGLGVLGDFGLEPIGSILLDEKLGLHLAFGRSDHFGGTVGPSAFTAPEAVVHVDRVYIPGCQPQVAVREVTLHDGTASRPLMRDGSYVEAF
jgi:hypothetical protein